MKGWALLDDYPVGRSPDWCEIGLNQAKARDPVAGDVIALAATVDGPLRDGIARVVRAERQGTGSSWKLFFAHPVTNTIPTATGYDVVYLATAIGESAFDPAPSPTIQ